MQKDWLQCVGNLHWWVQFIYMPFATGGLDPAGFQLALFWIVCLPSTYIILNFFFKFVRFWLDSDLWFSLVYHSYHQWLQTDNPTYCYFISFLIHWNHFELTASGCRPCPHLKNNNFKGDKITSSSHTAAIILIVLQCPSTVFPRQSVALC